MRIVLFFGCILYLQFKFSSITFFFKVAFLFFYVNIY